MRDNSTSIKFCLTGRSGLGHFRRIGNIAAAVSRIAPGVPLTLVANAPVAGLSAEEAALFDTVRICDRGDMAALLATLPAGPVVVDTAVIPQLAAIPDPLCLVLRETVAERLPDFRLGLGRLWDGIIVPSPPGHWPLDAAMPGTARIEHVGWIVRQQPAGAGRVLPEPDGRPRLLVATGGGGTAATAAALRAEIDPILAALRARMGQVTILQVAGPRLPLQGVLAAADTRVDVGARLNEAFREVDAVISTVGYNSVLELAAVDTPVLLVPIARSLDDQLGRAALWGPRLGRAHRGGQPQASAAWLEGVLAAHERRSAWDLGPSGDAAAAHFILSLADAPQDHAAWRFVKPNRPGTGRSPDHTATIAQKLFAQGIATLPSRNRGGALEMVRLPGMTLRAQLAVARGVTAMPDSAMAAEGLASAMAAVVQLHQATARHPGLSKLDPLGKVATHLAVLPRQDEPFIGLARELRDEVALRLARHEQRHAAPAGVVHGDLHAGQIVIAAAATERAWILDLDDLAIGPAEHDIANLAAHIATSADLHSGPILQGFQSHVARAAAAYGAAGGRPLDDELLALLGAAALLRRAAKLRRARRFQPVPVAILAASSDLLAAGARPPSPRADRRRHHPIPNVNSTTS